MKIENKLRIIIGSIVFITVLLGFFLNKYYLIITFLVGLNLFQFGFTNFCPLEKFLKKIDNKKI